MLVRDFAQAKRELFYIPYWFALFSIFFPLLALEKDFI
jgi:hypothetical protein